MANGWTFALAGLVLAGVLITTLSVRLRRAREEASRLSEWTAILYRLSWDLGVASDAQAAAQCATDHAVKAFGGGAAMLMPAPDGTLSPVARSGSVRELKNKVMSDAVLCFRLGRVVQPVTAGLPPPVQCIPVTTGQKTLGVLVLTAGAAAYMPDERREAVEGLTRFVAAALEHLRVQEEAEAATLRARTEEMRSSLLSAVSHDLRTPLAAITGAASALSERDHGERDGYSRELVLTISEEAQRLERLVGNLLTMTRLEAGAVTVQREWVLVEEVVGTALYRLESSVEDRVVHVDMPADLPMVLVDPVLLEQAFINLIDNAGKYSPPGTPIELRARVEDGLIGIEVADRGAGLETGTEEKVFEKFYRGPHRGVQGAGLGLAICRAIVEAHEGSVEARNRPDGGAVFRITLPALGSPPEVTVDEEARLVGEVEIT